MNKKVYLVYVQRQEIEEMVLSDSTTYNGNDIFNAGIDLIKNKDRSAEYFEYFDKKKTKKKLEKIVDEINNSTSKIIFLLTDKKDLFEFFNAEIYFIKVKSYYDEGINNLISINQKSSFNETIKEYIWRLESSNYRDLLNPSILKMLYSFFEYNKVFEIDLKLLLKGTAYTGIDTFSELLKEIYKDLRTLREKGLLLIRLIIVLKRLLDFNLNISTKKAGIEIKKILDLKSKVSKLYKYSYRVYDLSSSLQKFDFQAIEDDITLFEKLKKHEVSEECLLDVFGNAKYYTIKSILEEERIYGITLSTASIKLDNSLPYLDS